jgi:hypothetical protein
MLVLRFNEKFGVSLSIIDSPLRSSGTYNRRFVIAAQFDIRSGLEERQNFSLTSFSKSTYGKICHFLGTFETVFNSGVAITNLLTVSVREWFLDPAN